jgi:Tol biopolymer transport system component
VTVKYEIELYRVTKPIFGILKLGDDLLGRWSSEHWVEGLGPYSGQYKVFVQEENATKTVGLEEAQRLMMNLSNAPLKVRLPKGTGKYYAKVRAVRDTHLPGAAFETEWYKTPEVEITVIDPVQPLVKQPPKPKVATKETPSREPSLPPSVASTPQEESPTTKLPTAPKTAAAFQERLLAKIPSLSTYRGAVFSPNGSMVAYTMLEKKWHVVVGESWGPEVELLLGGSPFFTRNGSRVWYHAIRDGKPVIFVADGRKIEVKGTQFDGVGVPLVSDDGTKLVYVAETRIAGHFKQVVVEDKHGQKILGEEFGGAIDAALSPDGSKVAFIAWQFNTELKKMRYFVFIGENKIDEGIGHACCISFSPDGRKIAYAVTMDDPFPKKEEVTRFYIVGNQKGPEFRDGKAIGCLAFSPDGKRHAYVAGLGTKSKKFVIVDHNKGQEFYGIRTCSLSFSPDGERLTYAAAEIDEGVRKWFIVTGGIKGEDFDDVGSPVFSFDSKRLAYAAARAGKWFIVLGDRRGELFDQVDFPVFSPDGRLLAYRARKGRIWLVVVGNQKSEEFDEVGSPIFSPDSRQVAFGARKGMELWWKVMKINR